MRIDLPASLLGHDGRGAGWTGWLGALPRLVASVLQEWQLVADGPAAGGAEALVLPVRDADGGPAALKLGWPQPESAQEHLALRAWDGAGAVRLLRADPRRRVLLLERAEPGEDLHTVEVLAACQIVAGLYGRLHRAPLPQLDRLSEQAAHWAEELVALRGTTLAPRRFVDQAIGLTRELAADPGTDVALVHTDLHFGNVLSARREPWLAIDPAPLAGDPAYEVAPLLWNRWAEAVASGDLRNALLDRLHTVVDAAGLDEDRVRDWVTVREMVNVLWASQDPEPDRDWVTVCTTVTKAVQR